MTRIGRHYYRAYYRLHIRRGRKLRLAYMAAEYEETDMHIRMFRKHHGLDRTASLTAWSDDFPRARRTCGWKDHRHRHQWEHRVCLLEKHARIMRRKGR